MFLPSLPFLCTSLLVGWLVSEFILQGSSLELLTSLVLVTIPSIFSHYCPSVPQEFLQQKRLHTPRKSLGHPITHPFLLCVHIQTALSFFQVEQRFVSLLEKGRGRAPVFHKGTRSFSACIFELLCSVVCSVACSCCQEGFVFPKGIVKELRKTEELQFEQQGSLDYVKAPVIGLHESSRT